MFLVVSLFITGFPKVLLFEKSLNFDQFLIFNYFFWQVDQRLNY